MRAERRHPRRRDERGAGLVEFALVVPLILGMLLGIFTGGAAYVQKLSLVDAAREGARYGASLKHDPASGGLATWRANVRDRIVQLSGGEMTAAGVCVDLVTPTGSNTNCGVSDPTGAATDPSALAPASLVKVSVSKEARIELVFTAHTPTISAKVVARYERDLL